jgi:hypothetical protein
MQASTSGGRGGDIDAKGDEDEEVLFPRTFPVFFGRGLPERPLLRVNIALIFF